MYKFKAKDSKIKPYSLCLGNILKDFTIGNIIDTNGILDFHKYLRRCDKIPVPIILRTFS